METELFIFAAVAISQVFSACAPTNAKFSNFWKSPKRRIPFNIGVIAKKCPGLNEFYYLWKVEEYPALKTVQTSTSASIDIDGYTYDSNVCYKTEFRVTVKISHYPDMSSSDETSGLFRFSPDEMQIEIVGGIERTHKAGELLIIDAKTLSRDSSYPPDEDPFQGNIVKWVIQPQIEGFNPPDELVLKIPGKFLNEGDIYVFTVSVKRTKISGYENYKDSHQIVWILAENTPQLVLKCMRNCVSPYYLESTVFTIECRKNCEDLEYTWSIQPPAPPGAIQFGDGYGLVIIDGGTYNPGDEVSVSFLHRGFPHTISVTFTSGLEQGNCSISPSEGISAVTKFTLKCEGFSSPNGLSLVLVFQKSLTSKFNVLLNEFSYAEESDLFIAPGKPATLLVYVEDQAFLTQSVTLTVNVEQFEPEEDILVRSAIKKLTLSRSFNSITSYSVEGLNDEVVQLISSLLDAIEYYKLDDATTRDLHKHMVEAILRSKSVRLSSAVQNVLILWKIQNYKKGSDSVTARLIGHALLDLALDVHQLYVHKHNFLIPFYYIEMILKYALVLCGNLLKKNTVMENILNDEVPPHNYDSYDELMGKKLQIRDDYRSLTTEVFIALQTSCITTISAAIPDERAHRYESTVLNIELQRIHLLNLTDSRLSLPISKSHKQGTVVYIPSELTEDIQKNYSYIDYQLISFKADPFWWHKNASTLNTKAVLFDLFFHCKKLRKISTPFSVYLEIVSLPRTEIVHTLSLEDVVAYKVELEQNVTLVVECFNLEEHPHNYIITWSDCFCTEEDFSSTKRKVISKNLGNKTRIIRIKHGIENNAIYICVKKLTPMLTFRLLLVSFSCVDWNYFEEKWRKDGCYVAEPYIETNNGTMICDCFRTSVIMGEIIAPPTTIVLNSNLDFTISFVKNNVMVRIILGLVILWVVSLILAHLRDKSMKKKNVVYKLDDNVPGDSNPYLVVVFTGIFYDAQTTADVAFRIVGDKAKSRAHIIKCQGTTLLKRNSQDWLMLYTPYYLGHIKRLRIWHNCKGRYPHWYCDRVIVQDLKVGEQYCFTVKKWFSVIWGNGRIYREIRLKRPSTKMSNILFRTQFERDIKDKHIWMSVLTRDIQSNFNSKERVSTGFCFLFVSILANALLYGVPQGTPMDSVDEQPNFDVTLSNIIILIESWIVATSLSFLIFFIFKNSAPL